MSLESGKIFVGGLSQQVTSSVLMEYFLQFGVILDAVVMYDNVSGRSRGFGFVTFKDPKTVEVVQNISPHIILGKVVDCKRASPRSTNLMIKEYFDNTTDDENMQDNGAGPASRGIKNVSKIFVGGLPDLTLEEFKIYFQRFGSIKDAVLITDKNSGRPRGFGFVTFESVDAVNNVTKFYSSHYLKGKWVECKRALPRDGV
ncbi:RNA recognition motif (RRM)-containing protein [Cryptosporidium canis]|uniref:RNA recognition motif (RRM)-containing protein n=1 Tax=Cryptosporidium canis TaxID=195482 RepID=A0ABQ8P4S7_9CRYT|nr:RNA recognition motif (RRM)-containing protein [Cryptosporidium canis]KAJ1611075.1 RNA recognition motif (RRM)-containing protein [Cryptosporidium canis]